MKQPEQNALTLLGGLDDSILDLAESSRGASRRSRSSRTVRTLILKRVLPIAACLCLLLGSILIIGGEGNASIPYDPNDYTTWQDRNHLVSAEKCEQLYQFITFDEAVRLLGQPYKSGFFRPDYTFDEQSIHSTARWIVDNGGLLTITFAPLKPDISIDQVPIDKTATLNIEMVPYFDHSSGKWISKDCCLGCRSYPDEYAPYRGDDVPFSREVYDADRARDFEIMEKYYNTYAPYILTEYNLNMLPDDASKEYAIKCQYDPTAMYATTIKFQNFAYSDTPLYDNYISFLEKDEAGFLNYKKYGVYVYPEHLPKYLPTE